MLTNSKAFPTIAVKDLEAARKFYGQKLGLQAIGGTEDEVQLYRSGSGSIEVYRSEFAGTNKATSVSWEVDDIEGEVKALRDKGVSFEHYANMPGVKLQGDVHVFDGIKTAWFKDPDGNILCLHTH